MLEGRVTVNGDTVTELGTKADPAVDDIRVDGRRIRASGAEALHAAEQAARLRRRRGRIRERRPTVIDLLQGRARVRLPGRPARLRLRRAAAPDQRRRPGGAADASAPRRRARLRGARARRCRDARSHRERLVEAAIVDRGPTLTGSGPGGGLVHGSALDAHACAKAEPAGAEDVRGDRPPGAAAETRRDRADRGRSAEAGPVARAERRAKWRD